MELPLTEQISNYFDKIKTYKDMGRSNQDTDIQLIIKNIFTLKNKLSYEEWRQVKESNKEGFNVFKKCYKSGIFKSQTETKINFFSKDYFSKKDYKIKNKIENLLEPSQIEIRSELREFVMDLCNKNYGNPISLEGAINLLKQYSQNHPLIMEELNILTLFSVYECKTGSLKKNPSKTIQECILNQFEKNDHILHPQGNDDATIQKMHQQRKFALNNLQTIYKKLLQQPEPVNSKCFPLTTAWYIGSTRQEDLAPFEDEMQVIGDEHNIYVITDSLNHDLSKQRNTLLLDDSQVATYPQDYVDFALNEIRVPVHLNPSEVDKIRKKIQQARADRDNDWTIRKDDEGTSINAPNEIYGIIGRSLVKNFHKKAVNLASAIGATSIMNITYSEGGNALLGVRNDSSMYAIIGKDSYEASKLIMTKDLGRDVTEEEIRMAFAIDYGIKKESLYFVEQPGDFHLDMNVMIIGPNTVVVNDAVQAEEIFQTENQQLIRENNFKGEIEEIQKRGMRYAKLKKIFEDKTTRDLEMHGFKVIRAAGRFDFQTPYDRIPKMNFFNTVTAKTFKGKKLVVGMGVINQRYKDYFLEIIRNGEYYSDLDFKNVYFLNNKSTEKSLEMHGGISCRTKTI